MTAIDASPAAPFSQAAAAASIDAVSGVAAADDGTGWSASRTPPIGRELSNEQAHACAVRHLASTGFSENIGGHVSWVDRADGSMLANPWGLWWEEVTASDIIRIDADGSVIEGKWDVTPAIHIHTELHRNRADARVVVHNHPYHATVLAALGVLPEILHQTTCMYDGDLVFVDEYDGEISDPSKGSALAQAIGDASIILLRNHGLIVTGETLAQATYRAASFDRQCRLMVDMLKIGGEFKTVPEDSRGAMKNTMIKRASEVYWAGAVRQLIAREPEVLN
ncbi:MAG: putative aldolase [Mycobacterium sp.]|nr:putative aldolase [Mycobacterium sp.]